MREIQVACDLCEKPQTNQRVETYPSWFEIKSLPQRKKFTSIVGCLRYPMNIEVCESCFKLFQNAVAKVVEDFLQNVPEKEK